MNLRAKKQLAARTLKVGKGRIAFVESRKEEIKEAITKQDIRDLFASKAIIIKNVKGRISVVKRKSRSVGNVRKKPNTRKQDYVKMTRKLRRFAAEFKKQGKLSAEDTTEIRKKIRNKQFRSLAHMKEYIGERTK